MKTVLWLVLILFTPISQAGEIYKYNSSDSDLLSNRKSENSLSRVKVNYSPDQSILDWNYNCSKDKFSGRKSCSLNKLNSNIMVIIFDGHYSVYVGRNHFPRTQSAIKIDDNKPIYGYEGASNTPQKVIEQMKKGKVAYTRYKEWPYEYDQDGETDLNGFAEKYAEMLKSYQGL